MRHTFNVITIDDVPSTNLLMQEKEMAGTLKFGDVIRAVDQTGGIGQRGAFWESEAGKNLTFSVFLDSHFVPSDEVFHLNKVISLAIYDYLVEKGIKEVKIKWPNDIYVGNKKIAGMLSHNSFLGNKLEHSIIGVGLNVNQIAFKNENSNPVSLKQISQLDYVLEDELNKLLIFIEKRWNQFVNDDELIQNAEYLNRLYQYNYKCAYKDEKGKFFGTIKGVGQYGRLLVEKESGVQHAYDIKAIEFL